MAAVVLLVSGIGVVLGGAPTPAAAVSAPANDAIAAAPLLTVPSTARRTITYATYDPMTDSLGCESGQTVWYRVRTTQTKALQLETTGSGYGTVINVFRGPRNALMPEACAMSSTFSGEAALTFTAVAGVTYFVSVGTCCSAYDSVTGTAVLKVHPARATVPAAVRVTSVKAGDVSGRMFVNGAVTCVRSPMLVTIALDVSQRNGTFVARATADEQLPCGPQLTAWAVPLNSLTGYAFAPGRAVVTVTTTTCDVFACVVSGPAEQIVDVGSAPNSLDT